MSGDSPSLRVHILETLNPFFSGPVTITLRRAEELKRHSCDTESSCDFYVRIFIDDQQVYETSKTSDVRTIAFDGVFTFQIIPASSRIRLELWDDDTFFNGADDLMLVAEYLAGSLNGLKRFSNDNVALDIFSYFNA